MNLYPVILPAKVLADGTHKIRIAVSHNSQTRYLPTRFTVPSPKNLKNGSVVGVNDAAYINLKIREYMNRIHKICDDIEDIDYYTCSQLLLLIQTEMTKKRLITFDEISAEWLSVCENRSAPSTITLHKAGISSFLAFAGKGYILSKLNSATIYEYERYLRTHLLNDDSKKRHDKQGLNDTSIGMRISVLHKVVNYAILHNYVNYKVPPFIDYKMPKVAVRNCNITVEELRQFRDHDFADKWKNAAKDLFMLSFYLCGMNLIDIQKIDLRKPVVSFIRTKTASRRDPGDLTEFTIQPEARTIIDKYITDEGHLNIHNWQSNSSLNHIVSDNLRSMGEELGFDTRLMFYSARKTFSQIANEILIKDSVIEYCLGDVSISHSRSLSFYVQVNRNMADNAIRELFDFVAGTLSVDEYVSSH